MKPILTLLLCSIACSILAAEPAKPKFKRRSPEQLKAAEEFQVNGISFKTTRAEFQNRFPNAKEAPTGRPKQYHFSVMSDTPGSFTSYSFDDEKLTQIAVLQVGNNPTAFDKTLEQLSGTFGKPDHHRAGSYIWFADTRTIGLTGMKSSGFMTTVRVHAPLPSEWYADDTPAKEIKPLPPVEQQK